MCCASDAKAEKKGEGKSSINPKMRFIESTWSVTWDYHIQSLNIFLLHELLHSRCSHKILVTFSLPIFPLPWTSVLLLPCVKEKQLWSRWSENRLSAYATERDDEFINRWHCLAIVDRGWGWSFVDSTIQVYRHFIWIQWGEIEWFQSDWHIETNGIGAENGAWIKEKLDSANIEHRQQRELNLESCVIEKWSCGPAVRRTRRRSNHENDDENCYLIRESVIERKHSLARCREA